MAAHRNGIKNVILPKQNEIDAKEIPQDVRDQLNIHFAENVFKYLELALEPNEDQQYKKDQLVEFGVSAVEQIKFVPKL